MILSRKRKARTFARARDSNVSCIDVIFIGVQYKKDAPPEIIRENPLEPKMIKNKDNMVRFTI